MICVSIGRGRHKHMIAEHGTWSSRASSWSNCAWTTSAAAIEPPAAAGRPALPVIVTCRREADGGKWTGTEEERLLLLRTAIAEGAEYVDLEEDIAGGIPRFGKTKRIVSYHDFRETPDDLEEIHRRLAADGCGHREDRHHGQPSAATICGCCSLIAAAKVPTIGLCMGEIGMPTRILAGKFGAPFTYATFHARADNGARADQPSSRCARSTTTTRSTPTRRSTA